MRKPYIYAVIGKNFGDEGKGLAVDYLAAKSQKTLVIRHNGGAQSGHTVDLPEKRFVFHELSSGSFRGADTLWADTYFPDIYKLGEEVEAFQEISGLTPIIYAQPDTQITLIDDVLLNMAAEEARGKARHGSCGMGIYEAQCRGESGFAITIGELWNMEEATLVKRLQKIREEYLPKRLQELELTVEVLGEYKELLENPKVLENAAVEMRANLSHVRLVKDTTALLYDYEQLIFENGQGLLLDSENEQYAPHVTASRTGLHNPCKFLQVHGLQLDEVIYVTRSYVTRHGAGPLPHECNAQELGIQKPDLTNVENKWQGSLRYARHGSVEDFLHPVAEDLQVCEEHHMHLPCRALMVTHLNETQHSMCMSQKKEEVREFCKLPMIQQTFDKFYLSASPYATEIIEY